MDTTSKLDGDSSSKLDGFAVHELNPSVRVRVVRPMPELDASLDAAVEELWCAAARRVAEGGAGTLFNGQVFSADRITPTEITGHVTEFRRIVAQMEQPALFGALGLRPLAVCGVLRCADGVPFGRRHPAAIYQPGMWQLPPAGSVDAKSVRPDGTVDLIVQVLAELVEELGIQPDQVEPPRPLCLVEHPGSHVSDVGIALATALTAAQVLHAHRTHANAEYNPLIVVPFAELADFVDRAGDLLVPPAHEFLARPPMG
ncbi:MAG TPA: hypothetical protein VFE41_31880 [Acetobacteraceae bacterium]|jgi:hypothetical protein|nr:hypothetical protein [Acetobacteraceae bacterium]